MKHQTKSRFINRKYRSILKASLAVEGASFLVTFTDSLIAGNLAGTEALAAVSLAAPFAFITTFLASVINSGTTVSYSYSIGRYDRKRANEVFSQGVLMAVLAGAAVLVVLELGCGHLIRNYGGSEQMKKYLADYYRIFCIYLSLDPLSVLLDNMVLSDGGEKLSAAGNIVEMGGNVFLSLLFGKLWGVAGIALASVVCKLAFLGIIGVWFFAPQNNLQFRLYFRMRDCLRVIQNGIIKASPVVYKALTAFVLNAFVLKRFGLDAFVLLGLAQRFIGASSMFVGLSQAVSPLAGTLRGEKNTLALHGLMRTACMTMLAVGAAASLIICIFAQQFVRAFGIGDPSMVAQGRTVLRMIGMSYVFQALASQLFIYYYLMEQRLLTFLISLVKELAAPLAIGVGISLLLHNVSGVWLGLSLAPAAALAVVLVYVCGQYGREQVPFLLPKDACSNINIYDFDSTHDTIQKTAVELSAAVMQLLEKKGFSERTQTVAGMLLEDTLLLISEQNPDRRVLHTECSVITEEKGVRMILRDSGKIDDITDDQEKLKSFRQYIVTRMTDMLEKKAYLTTTGYNRHEFYIEERQ